jgi:hypothetical protein
MRPILSSDRRIVIVMNGGMIAPVHPAEVV